MSIWYKIFTAVNVFIYEKSRGHLGNRLGRQSILLLHTTGRKSGKRYVTSTTYFRDGESYLIVASNWGRDAQPDWFLNLMQHPRTTIQVGPNFLQVEAHQAQGEEYQRLWQMVTQRNGQYISYQKNLKRIIPIVILTPQDLV